MVFFVYEQPMFERSQMVPQFCQRRVTQTPLVALDTLFGQEPFFVRPRQCFLAENNSAKNVETVKKDENIETSKDNSTVDIAPQIKSEKRKMIKAATKEDMEKLEIKLALQGYDLKPEDFEAKAINNEVLEIKADTEEEKFGRKFRLPKNVQVDKIECKFQVKEDGLQEITVIVPKQVKVTNIPVSVADS